MWALAQRAWLGWVVSGEGGGIFQAGPEHAGLVSAHKWMNIRVRERVKVRIGNINLGVIGL